MCVCVCVCACACVHASCQRTSGMKWSIDLIIPLTSDCLKKVQHKTSDRKGDTHTHARTHTRLPTHTRTHSVLDLCEETWQERRFMSWYLKSHLWHHRDFYLLIYAAFTATRLTACVTMTFLHNRFFNFTVVSSSAYSQHCCWSPKHTLTHAVTLQVSHSSLHGLLLQLLPVTLVSFSLFFHHNALMDNPLCMLEHCSVYVRHCSLVVVSSFREEKPPLSTPRVTMSHGKGPASIGRHRTI